MDGVPYPQPLTGHEPQYVPWGVLLVRPIGHPPRPVPPRAADQRSRAYPTLLRVLTWGRYGHRGGAQTPRVWSLASVSFGPLSPRPPPSAVLDPASPLSTVGFPPSRAPFCSPKPPPCPAFPLLSPSALARSGILFVIFWAGFRLPGAPTACRPSLPPALCSPLCPPPHFPFPSPRRHRPLPGGGGVVAFPPEHARCEHDASTRSRHLLAGGGGGFLSVRSSLLGLPARFGFSGSRSVGGGGLAVWLPSVPFVPCVPASGDKHVARTLQAHSTTLCNHLVYRLLLSGLLPFPPGCARCRQDASTWRGTCTRGGGCSLSARFWAAPLAVVPPVLALWGGGGVFASRLLPLPLVPRAPAAFASMMHAHCTHNHMFSGC